MRKLAALILGVIPVSVAAAPVPNVPPAPTIEGKYTVLAQGRAVTGKAARGGGFGGPAGLAADDDPRGFGGGPASALRRDTTITRDTITMETRTGSSSTTWEYRLDPSTKPMSIDIVVVPLIGKKTKLHGIVEQTGDRLKIAYTPEGVERPKDFDDTENAIVYVFQKAPPPPRTEYRIIAVPVGGEAAAEKELNQLAKEGFEIAFTATPSAGPGATPGTQLILKRTVSSK